MKKVFISGGSRGIGKATVKYFLKNNWSVITTSTTGSLDYNDQNLLVYPLDLGNVKSIEFLANILIDNRHEFNCVINNAWKIFPRSYTLIDLDILSQMLVINLIGTINLTQQLLPLIKKGGTLINISSEYGSLTEDWGFEVPAYRIAKAGINMFTRNIYKYPDIATKNIRVYSFDPGWVKTDMGGNEAPRNPEDPAEELFNLTKSNLPTGEFYRGLSKRDW